MRVLSKRIPMLFRLDHTRPWGTFKLQKLAPWLMMDNAKHKSLSSTAAILVRLYRKLGTFNCWMKLFGCPPSSNPHHVKSVAHIQSFLYFPRNCPPTPTGVVSRDSSGDKRHLHVSFLTPRPGGSASRWILTDLHRVETPYQYPVLVSGWVAHCSRGQYGRRQKKNPTRLWLERYLWQEADSGALKERNFPRRENALHHERPNQKPVGFFTFPSSASCHTDSAIIMSPDRLCKPYWLSSRANGGR